MIALLGLILAGLAVAILLDMEFGRRQTRRAEVLLLEGGVAFAAGDLDRAARLWRKAATSAAWVRGGPLFFLAHYNLANVLVRKGNHGAAEKAARRALGSLGSLPDSVQLGFRGSYPEVRHCLALFAESLVKQAKFTEAIAYYEAVVKLWNEADGEDSMHAGYYSQELGLACARLGLFDQAIDHLAKAVAVARIHFAKDHPALATALSHHGEILVKMGRAYDAQQSLEEALAIRTSLYGTHHPGVAAVLVNLGSLHSANGDCDEAAGCFQKAMGVLETELGANHPEVAAIRGKLADTRRRQGRLTESEQLASMAIAILGESKDLPYSEALETMAQLRADQGGLAEAAQLLKQSRQLMERTPGTDLSRRARLLHNEARLLRQLGDAEKADQLASLALAIRETIRSAPTPSEAARGIPPAE